MRKIFHSRETGYAEALDKELTIFVTKYQNLYDVFISSDAVNGMDAHYKRRHRVIVKSGV